MIIIGSYTKNQNVQTYMPTCTCISFSLDHINFLRSHYKLKIQV